MTFINLMTNKVVVSRLTIVSGDKTAFQTLTTEYVSIQRSPTGTRNEDVIGVADSVGMLYRMYAETNADIQKGDKLVDTSGEDYKVNAIVIPATLGSFQHLECIITKVK